MWPTYIQSTLYIHQKKSTQAIFKPSVIRVVAVFNCSKSSIIGMFFLRKCLTFCQKCSSVQGFFVLKVIKATRGGKIQLHATQYREPKQKTKQKNNKPRGGTFCYGIANIYLLLVAIQHFLLGQEATPDLTRFREDVGDASHCKSEPTEASRWANVSFSNHKK